MFRIYCDIIRWLSNDLWIYNSYSFANKLNVPEIGITSHLILTMRKFFNDGLIEAYSLNAPRESIRGADIDLFVQGSDNRYRHFMLQAKVMNYQGRYSDISKWNPNAQFMKLIKAASSENAHPFYLLYNGDTINSTRLPNPSKFSETLNDYGLAIINATAIKDFRLTQHRDGYIPGENTLSFNILSSLTPVKHRPFHDLFCNWDNYKLKGGSLTRDQIHTDYPYIRIDESIKDETANREDLGISDYSNFGKFRLLIPFFPL